MYFSGILIILYCVRDLRCRTFMAQNTVFLVLVQGGGSIPKPSSKSLIQKVNLKVEIFDKILFFQNFYCGFREKIQKKFIYRVPLQGGNSKNRRKKLFRSPSAPNFKSRKSKTETNKANKPTTKSTNDKETKDNQRNKDNH